MRIVLVLISIALLPSCARPDYAEARPNWLLITAGPQPGYAIKRVVEKQGPITLVGDDGSVCRTSRERLAATALGSWISCSWILPGLDTTRTADLSFHHEGQS
jgi:hypothetical protein